MVKGGGILESYAIYYSSSSKIFEITTKQINKSNKGTGILSDVITAFRIKLKIC